MTAGHTHETLQEALPFFLNGTLPAAEYRLECSSWLLIDCRRLRQNLWRSRPNRSEPGAELGQP